MNYYVLFFVCIIAFSTCQKDKKELSNCDLASINHSSCGIDVLEDSVAYSTISNTLLAVSQIKIIDDCLSFKLSASGCSGDTWVVNVIDAQTFVYTNPLTKSLKIDLYNSELCEAIITKEFHFDLFPLRECSDSIINLKIVNADTSVLYIY